MIQTNSTNSYSYTISSATISEAQPVYFKELEAAQRYIGNYLSKHLGEKVQVCVTHTKLAIDGKEKYYYKVEIGPVQTYAYTYPLSSPGWLPTSPWKVTPQDDDWWQRPVIYCNSDNTKTGYNDARKVNN